MAVAPALCCGSESGFIRKFLLDPYPEMFQIRIQGKMKSKKTLINSQNFTSFLLNCTEHSVEGSFKSEFFSESDLEKSGSGSVKKRPKTG